MTDEEFHPNKLPDPDFLWDAGSLVESAEARVSYLIVRARYYNDWPKDKETYLSVLADFETDLAEIKKTLRRFNG